MEKEGWLNKSSHGKWQKRYFLLTPERTLVWLTHPLGKMKGSLDLKDYLVEILKNNEEKTLILKPNSNDKKEYKLQSCTKDNAELQSWATALETAIKYRFLKQEKGNKFSGWLEKKGKKRWFLLQDDGLYWFSKEQLIHSDIKKNMNGKLELLNLQISEAPESKNSSLSFSLSNNQGDQYILTAKTENEKKLWITNLQKAVEKSNLEPKTFSGLEKSKNQLEDSGRNIKVNSLEKSGWLWKKGKKRYFILKNDVLVWFIDEAKQPNFNNARGHIVLKECTVTKTNDEFSFCLQTSVSTSYILTAKTYVEADEWIQYLTKSIEYANSKNIKNIEESRIDDKKTGWMEKKGVKRWFILTLDQLQWFENDTSTKCKNSLPLYCCSVNEVSKTSFILTSPFGKSYSLITETEYEKKEWIQALSEAIFKSSQILISGVEKFGWLEKKSKRRWFVLRRNRLLWFSQMQTFQDSVEEKSNNNILLSDYVIKGDLTNHSIILDGNTKIYSLKATNQTEAWEWLTALTLARNREAKKLGKVFGIPLSSLSVNEMGVPVFLSYMLKFLSAQIQNGEQFLKGASHPQRLLDLRDQIDKGEKPEFSNEDISAVVALLKNFFRDLPDPVFSSEFINNGVLELETINTIKNSFKLLSAPSYKITKELFQFFHFCIKNSSNKLNADNLALSFGACLFRINAKDTSTFPLIKVLSLIRKLIVDYPSIFIS